MEVVAHAFVSAERGRFDVASDGPFALQICFVSVLAVVVVVAVDGTQGNIVGRYGQEIGWVR